MDIGDVPLDDDFELSNETMVEFDIAEGVTLEYYVEKDKFIGRVISPEDGEEIEYPIILDEENKIGNYFLEKYALKEIVEIAKRYKKR